jgi:hypothetical protein
MTSNVRGSACNGQAYLLIHETHRLPERKLGYHIGGEAVEGVLHIEDRLVPSMLGQHLVHSQLHELVDLTLEPLDRSFGEELGEGCPLRPVLRMRDRRERRDRDGTSGARVELVLPPIARTRRVARVDLVHEAGVVAVQLVWADADDGA